MMYADIFKGYTVPESRAQGLCQGFLCSKMFSQIMSRAGNGFVFLEFMIVQDFTGKIIAILVYVIPHAGYRHHVYSYAMDHDLASCIKRFIFCTASYMPVNKDCEMML